MIVFRYARFLAASMLIGPFLMVPMLLTIPISLVIQGIRVGWILTEEILEWWGDEGDEADALD